MSAELKIDRKEYGRLLAKTAPRVPQTEKENDRLLKEINRLMSKPEEKLSPAESELLNLLGTLVEEFQRRYGFEAFADIPLNERRKHLMEENDLRPTDLVDIFGHLPTVSAVLAGKRGISRRQAVKLGQRFKLQPACFIHWG